MNRSNSNADPGRTQTYIETSVAVGDPILIEAPDRWAGKALMHRSETGGSRQIGVPSKAVGQSGGVTDLKVSAVIRYEPKPDDRAQPCPRVAAQGGLCRLGRRGAALKPEAAGSAPSGCSQRSSEPASWLAP